MPKTNSLDLGCGSTPKNPYNADNLYGIDVQSKGISNIISADLVLENIPFEDNFFDYVTAYDFIEHIPRLIYTPSRKTPFLDLMAEIYRVLKVDGLFHSFTPAFPHAAAFWDPTHVNFITEETFPVYFDDVNNWARIYGFKGAFHIEDQHWEGPHLISIMRKVPPLG